MFTLFTGRHVGGLLKEVLQHGGSILGSVILCGTFRRISQLWDNVHTLNLENCLLYLSSIQYHNFLDFIRCMVFIYFLSRDNAHAQYCATELVLSYIFFLIFRIAWSPTVWVAVIFVVLLFYFLQFLPYLTSPRCLAFVVFPPREVLTAVLGRSYIAVGNAT